MPSARVFQLCGRREVPLEFTVESVSCMFGGSMAVAARHFGVSLSSMQVVCRGLGVQWPKSDPRSAQIAERARQRAEKARRRAEKAAASESRRTKELERHCARSQQAPGVVRVCPRGSGAPVDFTVDVLSCMFGGTQQAAALHFGVSLWTMKKICRCLGMGWPKSDSRREERRSWQDASGPERAVEEYAAAAGLPAWQEGAFDEASGPERAFDEGAADFEDYTGDLCLASDTE